jgi:hypothetical protein
MRLHREAPTPERDSSVRRVCSRRDGMLVRAGFSQRDRPSSTSQMRCWGSLGRSRHVNDSVLTQEFPTTCVVADRTRVRAGASGPGRTGASGQRHTRADPACPRRRWARRHASGEADIPRGPPDRCWRDQRRSRRPTGCRRAALALAERRAGNEPIVERLTRWLDIALVALVVELVGLASAAALAS